MSSRMLIGQKIKIIREREKITQKELGEILSKSESSISHYENGSRSISLDELMIICEHFDIRSDELLGLNNDGISDNNKIKLSDDEIIFILELRKTKSYKNMISNPKNYAKLIEMKTSNYKSDV